VIARGWWIAALAIIVAGCSGGGGATNVITGPTAPPSGALLPTSSPTIAPPPTYPPSLATTITAGSTAQSVALGTISGGVTGTVSIPATVSGSGAIPLLFQTTPPGGVSISTIARLPQTIGVSLTPLAYVALTPSATVTFPTSPSFTIALGGGSTFASGSFTYVGFYDPTSTSGWINLTGPGVVGPPSTATFAVNPVPMTLKAGVTYTFGVYSSAAIVAPFATPSPSPTPKPTPSPTPSASPTPTPGGGATPTVTGPGTPLAGPTLGPNTGWGPLAIANAFAYPVQSGYNGSGSTIAVVNNSNVAAGDLAQYTSYFQTPVTSRTVSVTAVDGAALTPGANGDPTEATLDLETIAGLAPGANIALYIMPALSSQYYNDAFNQIVSDGKATIVSISFAGCESVTSSGTRAIIANAVQAGIAFVAAAGDQGSTCFSGLSSTGASQYAVGVGYPASDPNVVGVGGTETNTSLLSTTAWNDTLSTTGQLASGGGVSSLFALPTYQTGLAGAASAQFRNVPDIAMPAVLTALYLNGQWTLASGTSWAAPEFAAMLAEVSQYCAVNVANAAPSVYAAYASAGSTAFLDVVNGNNAVPFNGGTSPAFAAHAGYDNVSGLGVPMGMPFARALCPNRVASARLRSASAVEPAPLQARRAYAVDVVPKVVGLTDAGRRAAAASTRIQLVLQAAPTLATSEAAVINVLRAAGFQIDRTFPNHLVVDADGGSATVEQLFATQLHDVRQATGTRYMPVTAATVPDALAPYVAGIVLDNVVNAANR
jgi:hypothetical protein